MEPNAVTNDVVRGTIGQKIRREIRQNIGFKFTPFESGTQSK